MPDEPLKNREVIFEMLTVGNAVKVTAVDVKTMTEATFQGPASSTHLTITIIASDTARKKLTI